MKRIRITYPTGEHGYLRPTECFFCEDNHLHLSIETCDGHLGIVEVPITTLLKAIENLTVIPVSESRGTH
jgi:hypothetical protein